ncbi:MAG: O-antigen ligase family protein [Paracoccaceae bacterium]
MNAIFAWFCVALVAVAPLPLGSNRPVFWMLWACLIGVFFMLFMVAKAIRRTDRPLRTAGFAPHIALALVLPGWGLIQALPIGDWARALSYPNDLSPWLRTGSITIAPGATVLSVIRLVSYVVFFALVLETASRAGRVAAVIRAIFLIVTAYAVSGLVMLTVLGDAAPWGVKSAYHGMATGPFVNRNSFASFLGLGLVIGVTLLMESGKDERQATRIVAKLALALATGLIFAALLATQSRLGLASSLVGAFVAGVAMRPGVPRRRRAAGRSIRIMTPVAILAIGLAAFGTPVAERLLFSAPDLGVRLAIYGEALARIAERPLTGYGLDSFALVHSLGRADAHFDDLIYTDAHSTYLENWVEGGLIAGSAPILLGVLVASRLLRSLGDGTRTAAAAACGGLVLCATHSALDFPFEIEANMFLLLLVIALGLAAPRRGADP